MDRRELILCRWRDGCLGEDQRPRRALRVPGAGRPKEGLASLKICIRLDPRNPWSAIHLNRVALGLYFARDYEGAVEAAKRTIHSYPGYMLAYRWLAAALGQLGRSEEAKEVLEKAIATAPAQFDMYVRNHVPWKRPEDYAHMIEGLRRAGWEG